MTSIEDNIVKRRVLIDWDGDGNLNEGVRPSTPPNLFPSQLYTTGSKLVGLSNLNAQNYTDAVDTDGHGFVKRSIRLGDQAITTRFMWNGYANFQPQTADPTNLIQGGVDTDFGSWEWSGGSQVKALSVPTPGTTLLAGRRSLLIGSNVNWGYMLGCTNYNSAAPTVPLHNYGGTGFIVGTGNQYTQGLNSSTTIANVVYGGFPSVVAGQSYTFVAYMYLPSNYLANGATGSTVNLRLYSNGGITTTPNFTRQYMGGVDFTLAVNTWTSVRITFTVPTGGTKMFMDVQGAGTPSGSVKGAYIGGMMLFNGTVALPSRYWDDRVTFTSDYFSYLYPGDSSDYVMSYWVRSLNGITKLTPTKHIANIGLNVITDTSLTAITVTNTWQRVDVSIAASASDRGMWLTFTAEKSGVPVDGSHAGDVEFDGFQITKGTSIWPYHSGTLYGYDDITDLVLSVDTKNGKTNFNDVVPAEGNATILLNNDSQMFSPSNTASPLYGYLKPNLKVKIQLWNGTEYIDIWSGWTEKVEVEPGRSKTRQATLTALQGVFRLAEGTLSVPITTNANAIAIAEAIIESSGWRSTAAILQSFVGLYTLVGNNAYTLDTDQVYDLLDDGVNIIEITGRGWAQNTDPRKALEDVLQSENAQMYINRDGSISLFDRNHWITTDVTDTIVLDTAVNNANYEYGTDIVNAVETTIVKNKALLNQPVWSSKRPTPIVPNQVWVIELNSAFTEGTTRTVIRYTLDGMTKSVYTADVGINNVTSGLAATQAQSDLVIVELLGQAGQQPKLRVTNKNSTKMWISLSIKGDYLDTGDGEITKVEDATSIQLLQGKHLATYTSNVLSDSAQAESYGDYLMQRMGEPHGEFKNFDIYIRNTSDLNRVLGLSVGDIVILSEVQTEEDEQYHAIIGEEFHFSDSKTFRITYTAARTLQENFYKADISVVENSYENEIPAARMLQSKSTNGGVFGTQDWQKEGIQDLMYWQTGSGHDNRLVLAPTRDQLFIQSPVTGIRVHPATDSAGNVFNPNPVTIDINDTFSAPFFLTPPGQTKVAKYTLSSPFYQSAASGTAYILWGMYPTDSRDESVTGVSPLWIATFPLLPGGKYKARTEILGGLSSDALRVMMASSDRLRAQSSQQRLADWTGTAGSGAPSPTVENSLFNSYVENTFSANIVSPSFTPIPIGVGGFQFYRAVANPALMQPGGVFLFSLLRFSDYAKVGGTYLDTSVSHKYTLYARMDTTYPATSYTLTVFAEDGSTIGTDVHTISNLTPTKFEVNIPSGNVSAWAYLQKTTNDYIDNKVFIYSFGITANSVSSYLDLIEANDTEKVYA